MTKRVIRCTEKQPRTSLHKRNANLVSISECLEPTTINPQIGAATQHY